MLPRARRLPRASFPLAAAGPLRAASTHLSLSASNAVAGYAVVVSKKVARRSVDRHRLKRRLFSLLRGGRLPSALVVYARKGAAELPFPALKEELRALLAKVA